MSKQRIRIPRSARRRRVLSYAKLLKRILPIPTTGFHFEGTLLEPGSRIEKADLWPSPDYPLTPLLLEYAGSALPGWGHDRRPGTYILWRWEGNDWRELARTTAQSHEWCAILGPVAARAMQGDWPPAPSPEYSVIAGRLTDTLERELARVDAADQGKLLCLIHDLLMARLSTNSFSVRPELQFRDAAASSSELEFRKHRNHSSGLAPPSFSEKKYRKKESRPAGQPIKKTLDRKAQIA